MYQINLPSWGKLINKSFIPLVDNQDRYIICYGGRGSSKSVFAAKKLIYRCLTEPYFRYVLYRKTYNTIKDSQYQTIKDIVEEWGLEELFIFRKSPLEIECINGNSFICRGGDEPKKLKSIKDPTGVWYEEEIPEEGDFITITTSIRTTKAEYLQEVFTINPEVEGDYTEHWFWKRYFEGKDKLSFSDTTVVKSGEDTLQLGYTVHHSTYKDNKWLPKEFAAQLEALKETNPYYYTIYVLGMWGNKKTEGNFYPRFDRAINVIPKAQARYSPEINLHITLDFNVNPYVTLNVHQLYGKKAIQIDEICLPYPDNNTAAASRYFAKKYAKHKAAVFVYGDPSGLAEDTRSEKGHNDFVIVAKELKTFKVQMRYQKKAPPVTVRGMFINDVFADNEQGLEFLISDACVKTIEDYTMVKMASDGTKAKLKTRDPETGVSYEKHGHTSDANDYFYCSAFSAEFAAYQKGGVTRPILGKNVRTNV